MILCLLIAFYSIRFFFFAEFEHNKTSRVKQFFISTVCPGGSNIIYLDNSIRTLAMNFICDCMRQCFNSIPHRIISHGNLILLISICPLGIFLNDLLRMVSPYHAMRRSNDINRQIQLCDFLKLASDKRCKRIQNIGETFHCLFFHTAPQGFA